MRVIEREERVRMKGDREYSKRGGESDRGRGENDKERGESENGGRYVGCGVGE